MIFYFFFLFLETVHACPLSCLVNLLLRTLLLASPSPRTLFAPYLLEGEERPHSDSPRGRPGGHRLRPPPRATGTAPRGRPPPPLAALPLSVGLFKGFLTRTYYFFFPFPSVFPRFLILLRRKELGFLKS